MCTFIGMALAASKTAGASPALHPDDLDPDQAVSAKVSRAARLSFVEGSVRVTQDSQVIADPAVANMPLFEGAEIATANDGRAEIQLEDGSLARLSPNSTLVVSVLQRQGNGSRTELVLRNGLAYFELQPSNVEHKLRVNYGDASFTANNFSVVRLTCDAPPAELAVFAGSVRLERGDALQLNVNSGESLTLDAADPSRYNLGSTIGANSWDNWNTDRDQFLNGEAADKTAATGGLNDYPSDGMSDLDANGNWYNVPGQGYVWSPYDAQAAGAGWDPYAYGNWVFYPRFGYVWVSGYAWGYSPFQCGLWDYYEEFGWAWAPGAGCNAWWGGGGGWIYRIGNNRPPGYHPPRRPRPEPGPGRPHPRGPVVGAPHRGDGPPMIAVDRRVSGASGASSAVAHEQGPVFIAGQAVEPLPHLAARQGYLHTGDVYMNRQTPVPDGGHSGGMRTIYTPTVPARPAPYLPAQRPVAPRPEPMRPAPAPHMSAPPPPPPHAAAPAPHK